MGFLLVYCRFGFKVVGPGSWGCGINAHWKEVCGNYCVQRGHLSTHLDVYWTCIPCAGSVDGMHFAMCVYVNGKYAHALAKAVSNACGLGSSPEAMFHHDILWSSSLLSTSPSLLFHHFCFVMVWTSSTDWVCLFELFTFFRDLEYTNIAQCVYALCVREIPNILFFFNDVQNIWYISCTCLQACFWVKCLSQDNLPLHLDNKPIMKTFLALQFLLLLLLSALVLINTFATTNSKPGGGIDDM